MAGRKSAYKPEVHDDLAWWCSAQGMTYDEISEILGITKRTLIRWIADHESFGLKVRAGKRLSDAQVIAGLHKRATGMTTRDKKVVEKRDQYGTIIERTVTVTDKELPPDPQSIAIWLYNRVGDMFQREQPVVVESAEDADAKVRAWIAATGVEAEEDLLDDVLVDFEVVE